MESEMDAELRFHTEAYAQDLIRTGVPRQEAMRRARLEFGGIERAKELVLRETLGVTLAGLAMGTLGAFALTRFFPTGPIGWSGSGIYLYGISRADAVSYTCAAALLTTVAMAASWVPARRGTRVDPMVALRYE